MRGRKPIYGERMSQYLILMPPQLLKDIDQARGGTQKSEFIRQILKTYIDNKEDFILATEVLKRDAEIKKLKEKITKLKTNTEDKPEELELVLNQDAEWAKTYKPTRYDNRMWSDYAITRSKLIHQKTGIKITPLEWEKQINQRINGVEEYA